MFFVGFPFSSQLKGGIEDERSTSEWYKGTANIDTRGMVEMEIGAMWER